MQNNANVLTRMEHLPAPTPDHEITVTPENVQVLEALKIENVDELFADQITAAATASETVLEGAGPGGSANILDDLDTAVKTAESDTINNFLESNGIDDSHVSHDIVRDLLNKYSHGRSVPKQLEWLLGNPSSTDPEEQKSGRERFAEEVKNLFGEAPEPEPGIIEVDPALKNRMDQASDKFATEMARSRKSYIGRFFKKDTEVGSILSKIPGVKATVSGWNKVKKSSGMQAFSAGIDAMFERSAIKAQEEFESVYNEMAIAVAVELEARGTSAEMAAQLSLLGNIKQDVKLEEAIVEKRQLKSKSTNWFVNKWVEAKGIKGNLAKVGVVLGAGAVAGVGAGVFFGATAAFAAGMVAGGYIGTHVSSRRANSLDDSITTLAERQSVEDRTKKEELIRARHEAGEVGSVKDITGVTRERSDQELIGNRNRVKTSAAIGGLSGRAAIYGYDQLQSIFNNADSIKGSGHVVNGGPKHTPPEPPAHTPGHTPTPHPTPENPIRGLENFNVESGHGLTHELMDFAQANGHQITPEQANHLYENLLTRLGPNNIIDGGTYVRQAGDIGISSPGATSWTPQAQEILTNLLTLR